MLAWQHITFTMPHLLWPFFNNNWPLFNDLLRCATRAMLKWPGRQGMEIGIFCALHPYGRQLNQHPHILVSVTRGGLDVKHGVWRSPFFKKGRRDHPPAPRQLRADHARHTAGSGPHPRRAPVAAISAGAVRQVLKGTLREEDMRCLAKREVSWPLPEPPATLWRRHDGQPLSRSPHGEA
uniref:transposase n=1 Tax=Izhakiella capsodis TaxID=1367852 RepID=UPI002E78C968|nr:transposase [Izhakiella capsodis]